MKQFRFGFFSLFIVFLLGFALGVSVTKKIESNLNKAGFVNYKGTPVLKVFRARTVSNFYRFDSLKIHKPKFTVSIDESAQVIETKFNEVQ